MAKARSKSKKALSALDAKTFFAQKSARGDAVVNVDGFDVSLTKLNKVFWPKEGYTKFDLLKYYYGMWKTLAPYLKDRPLILKRYPNGIDGMMFYQHNIEDTPDFVDSFTRIDSEGKPVRYAIANNLATLLYLTNLGTITINPWFSRRQSTEKPDYFAFDLDPGDTATFEQVKLVALEVKKVLDEIGLKGYPKTSGSSGIHIYVPVKPDYTYDEIVPLAKKIATRVADNLPKDATVRRMTRDRAKHEVYVDYLQNIEGKTLAAAYSVREKPHATVSAPLEWKEINKKLQLDQFTIVTMPARLKKKGDLFEDVLKKKQGLAAAMKKLQSFKD